MHVSIPITDKCSIQLVTLSNRTFSFIVEHNHTYRVLMYLDHHLVRRCGARGFYHRSKIKYILEYRKIVIRIHFENEYEI